MMRTNRLTQYSLRASVALTACLIVACGPSKKPDPAPPAPPPAEDTRPAYVNFESGPVRPIAKTGNKVLITNTPNRSLEVFTTLPNGDLEHQSTVPVGIGPVAVNIAPDGSAWVVNHISDSISVVRFDQTLPYVDKTLLVGDEPRDIVFANGKAFITTAHRGQHRTHASLQGVDGAGDPALFTSGVSRADVWVFNANDTGSSVGGNPEKIVSLFGDTPRALAVTPDQRTVYVAVMHSGNQTAAVHESVMCHGFEDDNFGNKPCNTLDRISSPEGEANGQLPGGRTAPGVNKDGIPQPWTSMIVQYDNDSGEWRDSKDRNFSNGIRFHLPDKDVFAIDTETLTEVTAYPHVGTTLFNMAINPTSGQIYVSNTEANNSTRFEGPGKVGGSTVQGNIARSQITVIDPSANSVAMRPLNKHINYSAIKAPDSIKDHSVAMPNQMAITADGNTLYTAAMGSDKIAVYPTQDINDDALWDNQGLEFDPTQQNHIDVDGGPAGILLDDARKRLYVYTRFDNSLVSINTDSRQIEARLSLTTPEPQAVIDGRAMLYDAKRSSSNGEAACASCHIYGDGDQLSWNLGNPDSSNARNPQPFPTRKLSSLGCDFVGPNDDSCQLLQIINGDGNLNTIASMKGPMFTQTLRGMSTHGHMHWRGDRSVGYFGTDTAQTLDEKTSFKNFIVAFEGLLGLDIDLPNSVNSGSKSADVITLEQQVDDLADFMLHTQMPPNPIRQLDNSLSASASTGKAFFTGSRRSDGLAQDSRRNGPEQDGVNCEGCHGLDPAKGFYGTRGEIAHGGEIQILKVPQLRNLYTRVGMFGLPDRIGFLPSNTRTHQRDQIRGFGFLHDGATDLLFNFLKGGVFDNGELPCPPGLDARYGCAFNAGHVGIPNDNVRQALVQYLMEFESDLAPIVGQQVTLSSTADDAHLDRLELLMRRASTRFASKILGPNAHECDLVAHGIIDGKAKSYLFMPTNKSFHPDAKSDAILDSDALIERAKTANNHLTFTCEVPGAGHQMALDKDLDGILNRDD
ncbi:Uncharacterised protein [BD1-7 clade bacterium]|uniref:Cytochrome c domain-containing protein n=1 Tax=BD1-7 clade bacterium TaxID=2029982 RepID=A0A5S9MYN6_9GAMM|nr:Uncharacterised protein [BD1-7 clade bacterium]